MSERLTAPSSPVASTSARRVRPFTYSVGGAPHAPITRYTCTMCGSLNRASIRASPRKRSRPHA